MLKNEFVIGWTNIIEADYVGSSHGYTCDDDSAVGTTNGAGPRNVQICMLAPDLTVLQVLPGFWHPEDLATELENAKKLLAVWNHPDYPVEQKRAHYTQMQTRWAANQSRETTLRSAWQGFDAKNEARRYANGHTNRDTFVRDAGGNVVLGKNDMPKVKPINQLVHERLAARPFVKFGEYDIPAFTDYGRTYYDNNKKVDGAGETFMTPELREKQERKEQRQRQAEARAAERRAQAAEREARRQRRQERERQMAESGR